MMWLSPPTSTPRRKSSTQIITVVIRCNPRNLRPRSSAPQAIPLNVIPIIVNITTYDLVMEWQIFTFSRFLKAGFHTFLRFLDTANLHIF
jgi:hypothetical protein